MEERRRGWNFKITADAREQIRNVKQGLERVKE